MYYYQSCEHDGRPWYGRGWINKCDENECKEGEMRGLLNDSSNVSIDYDNVVNDGSHIPSLECCITDIR